MNNLLKQIDTIQNLDDMSVIIDAINRRSKQLRAAATRSAKKINVGDTVSVRSPEGKIEATLVKFRRTRAVIRTKDGLFNVSLSQVEAA